MPDDVHPQVQAMLDKIAEAGIPKVQDLTPQAARELVENLARARLESYPPPEVASVEERSTGAGYNHVPVRIYRASADKNAPVVVFYHGGGHVFGSLDSHDTMARMICRQAGCTVVSADYRMGPEHPFPAAVEDAYQAARWVADNAAKLRVDPGRLVVCGDSAGGNLSTVVALMARDSGDFAIAAQVLVYPVVDYRGGRPSHARYGKGYGILEAETVEWFLHHYIGDGDAGDWRAAPIEANSLEGLPPAFVLTAECDVLNDEGVAYAARLRNAGVEVEHIDYAGMIHGFFGYLGLLDDTDRAHADVGAYLKRVWSA